MSAITDALTRKFGPLPAWGWAGLGGGGLYLYRKHQANSASTTAATTTPDTASVGPYGQSPYGIGDGSSGGGSGGGDNGSGGSGSSPAPPTITVNPPPAATTTPSSKSSGKKAVTRVPKTKAQHVVKGKTTSIKSKFTKNKFKPRSPATVKSSGHTVKTTKRDTSKRASSRTFSGPTPVVRSNISGARPSSARSRSTAALNTSRTAKATGTTKAKAKPKTTARKK